MFLWLLVGGLTVGVTIGLLDVLVFHVDAINHQKSVSAGVDLALGLFLLAAGALVATGRLHGRRKAPVPAVSRAAGEEGQPGAAAAGRARLALAILVGAVIGIPGASYLTALHHLVAGKYSTATQVIAVFVFVFISFLLIIIRSRSWNCGPRPPRRGSAQPGLAAEPRQAVHCRRRRCSWAPT